MPEIKITIKEDNEVSDNNFSEYWEAIDFLKAAREKAEQEAQKEEEIVEE